MSKTEDQIKVIVVGDSGVGKSSLLLRFVNDQFNEFNQPTLGAAFISKVHQYKPNKSIRFQIWDTAGQEKYKSIAPIYYRESQVALCVYDITNKGSFTVLKNWVEQLKSKGPQNLLIAIVGNKIDKSQQQQVPYNQAKQYAQSINSIFKLTSAKEGKGIQDLFTSIAYRLEEKQEKQTATNKQNLKLKQEKNKNQKKDKPCEC